MTCIFSILNGSSRRGIKPTSSPTHATTHGAKFPPPKISEHSSITSLFGIDT